MTAAAQTYLIEINKLLDRLCGAIENLTEDQLNYKPPFPEANSVFVIATHTLGNAEAWVLGIACGRPIDRDRAAEFRSSGADAKPLIERARDLSRQFDEGLAALPDEALDVRREVSQSHWGAGETHDVSPREALLHVIEHAANHLGHIEVTRDLALAR
jgi:uncharacterized damage-inducible protein DinB